MKNEPEIGRTEAPCDRAISIQLFGGTSKTSTPPMEPPLERCWATDALQIFGVLQARNLPMEPPFEAAKHK